MAGGLYDQNPGFLEAMMYIQIEQQKYDKAQENKKKTSTMGPGGRPRRVAGQ